MSNTNAIATSRPVVVKTESDVYYTGVMKSDNDTSVILSGAQQIITSDPEALEKSLEADNFTPPADTKLSQPMETLNVTEVADTWELNPKEVEALKALK